MNLTGLWYTPRKRVFLLVSPTWYLMNSISRGEWAYVKGTIKERNELWDDSKKVVEEELCQW